MSPVLSSPSPLRDKLLDKPGRLPFFSVLVAVGAFLLSPHTVSALPQHWSSMLQKVANTPRTTVSLRMQQIHSLNFTLNPKVWQLQDIQTFEDRQRYEFSRNFSCISPQCPKKTLLSLTFVTYKYAPQTYTPDQLEKNFPLEKWRNIFKNTPGITATFKETVAVSDSLRQTSYGYRYNDLKIGSKPVNGLLDLLYFGQSQVRVMLTHPKTEQKTDPKFLQRLVRDVESTLSLQQLR